MIEIGNKSILKTDLKRIFGYNEFRGDQEKIIHNILQPSLFHRLTL